MSRLLVVSAGLSSPSSTRLLADQLSEAARAELGDEVSIELLELRTLAHPIANHLLTGFSTGALTAALDSVVAADALVVVTPVFSATYSGLFKSFFDLVETGALVGIPVILGATGGSSRHSLVLEHALRPLFTYLRAVPVPTGVFAATEDFGSSGLRERVTRAARELAASVRWRAWEGQVAPVEDVTPFEQQLRSIAMDS